MWGAVVLVWLATAGVGAYVATVKSRSWAEGALLGLILGPIGVLVAALLPEGQPGTRSVAGRYADPIDDEPEADLHALGLADEPTAPVADDKVIERIRRGLDDRAG